jgi:hypothetical protein
MHQLPSVLEILCFAALGSIQSLRQAREEKRGKKREKLRDALYET